MGFGEKLLLVFEQSELFGYCLGWRGGCGNVAEAVEDVSLRAQGLGLPLAGELMGLEREVGCAENEGYAAGLTKWSVGSSRAGETRGDKHTKPVVKPMMGKVALCAREGQRIGAFPRNCRDNSAKQIKLEEYQVD